MRYIFLIFVLFNTTIVFSQFQSGNVNVISPFCSYNLSGSWTDTTNNNSGDLQFIYDSVLSSWKYITPITSTNIEVCVNTIQPCPCDTLCQNQFFPNLNFNFTICNTVPIFQSVEREILIYPNPYKDFFTIDSPDLIYKISIISSTGLVIDEIETSEKKFTYSERLANGIYTILIFTNNNRKVVKIEKYD